MLHLRPHRHLTSGEIAVKCLSIKDKKKKQFKVGDTVYKQVSKTARSNKLEPKYLGPYTIVRIHPEQIAEIIGKHVNAKTARVHFRLLRRPERFLERHCLHGSAPARHCHSNHTAII